MDKNTAVFVFILMGALLFISTLGKLILFACLQFGEKK